MDENSIFRQEIKDFFNDMRSLTTEHFREMQALTTEHFREMRTMLKHCSEQCQRNAPYYPPLTITNQKLANVG